MKTVKMNILHFVFLVFVSSIVNGVKYSGVLKTKKGDIIGVDSE